MSNTGHIGGAGPKPTITPGSPRIVPMKVLSLGFPRTGTNSMAAALTQLGFHNCFHGFDMMEMSREPGNKIWEMGVDRKRRGESYTLGRKEFDEILWDCQACTDLLVTVFADELIEAYPEAKVILVERNIDTFFESYRTSIIGNIFSWPIFITAHLVDPLIGSNLGRLGRKAALAQSHAQTSDECLAKVRQVYKEHYAHIRSIVPPARLLNFDLKDEWGPLCAFLGVEVPATPFPRVNEKAQLQALADRVVRERMGLAASKLVSVLMPVVAAVAAYLWFQK